VSQQQADKGLSQKDLALKYGGRYSEGGSVYTVGAPGEQPKQSTAYSITIGETLQLSDEVKAQRVSESKSGGVKTTRTTTYESGGQPVSKRVDKPDPKYIVEEPSKAPSPVSGLSNEAGGRDLSIVLEERLSLLANDQKGSASPYAYDIYGEASAGPVTKPSILGQIQLTGSKVINDLFGVTPKEQVVIRESLLNIAKETIAYDPALLGVPGIKSPEQTKLRQGIISSMSETGTSRLIKGKLPKTREDITSILTTGAAYTLIPEGAVQISSKIGRIASGALKPTESQTVQKEIIGQIVKKKQQENPNAIIGVEKISKKPTIYQVTVGTEGRTIKKELTGFTKKGEPIYGIPKETVKPIEVQATKNPLTSRWQQRFTKSPGIATIPAKGERATGESTIVEFTKSRRFGEFKVGEFVPGPAKPSPYTTMQPEDILISGKIAKPTQKALKLEPLGRGRKLQEPPEPTKFDEMLKTARVSMEKNEPEYFAFGKRGLFGEQKTILTKAEAKGELKTIGTMKTYPGVPYIRGEVETLKGFTTGKNPRAHVTQFAQTKVEIKPRDFPGVKPEDKYVDTSKLGFNKKTGRGKFESGKTILTEPQSKTVSDIYVTSAKQKKPEMDILFQRSRFSSQYGVSSTGLISAQTEEPQRPYGKVLVPAGNKLKEGGVQDIINVRLIRGSENKEKLGFTDSIKLTVIPNYKLSLALNEGLKITDDVVTIQRQNPKIEIVEGFKLRDDLTYKQGHGLKLDLTEKLKFGDGFTPEVPTEPIIPEIPPKIPIFGLPPGPRSSRDFDSPSPPLGSNLDWRGNVPEFDIVGIYGKRKETTYTIGKVPGLKKKDKFVRSKPIRGFGSSLNITTKTNSFSGKGKSKTNIWRGVKAKKFKF